MARIKGAMMTRKRRKKTLKSKYLNDLKKNDRYVIISNSKIGEISEIDFS